MTIEINQLAKQIQILGKQQGFQQIEFSDIDLTTASTYLKSWLEKKHHGEMEYMASHGDKRFKPEQLVPGTLSIISVRMDYLTLEENPWEIINNSEKAFISRYALGRDYHKIIRKRLQNLAKEIEKLIGHFGYRVFTDSAPVMEKAIAEKAGLGWIGKHTNLINKQNGSWFFLGEIYTDLPLSLDQKPATNHCGSCKSCIDICPTQAIVAPYQLDARLCISYLTIEFKGSIPEVLRDKIGNRIYGCDDCLLACPWNRFAKFSAEMDFKPRHQLNDVSLLELFHWSESEFLQKFEGSPIRRIGYNQWLRNIAVALGNGPKTSDVITALMQKKSYPNEIVQEHVDWAINKLQNQPSSL